MKNLTRAPWIPQQRLAGQGGDNCWRAHAGIDGRHVADFGSLGHDDCQFTCLARAAFDVMMRRGWNPCKSPVSGNWRIDTNDGEYFTMPLDAMDTEPWEFADPFTALVEADKWYRTNVEAACPTSSAT